MITTTIIGKYYKLNMRCNMVIIVKEKSCAEKNTEILQKLIAQYLVKNQKCKKVGDNHGDR